MALQFAADGNMVTHSATGNLVNNGSLLMAMYPTSDTDRQYLYNARTASEYGGSFRGDLAGDPFDCFVARATTVLNCVVNAANFSAYGLNRWLLHAFVWNANGANADQKVFVGNRDAEPEEPSSYTTQQVGSGAVANDASTGLTFGNGAVTTREFKGLIAWVGEFNVTLLRPDIVKIWNCVKRGEFQKISDMPGCVLNVPYGIGTLFQQDLSRSKDHGVITGATQAPDPFVRAMVRRTVTRPPVAAPAGVLRNLTLCGAGA